MGVCPEYKPYCTDAGCVFECPEPLYINETVCVNDCGEMFVNNKLCEVACPENWFVRKIPKTVSGHVYIEKQCTQYCDSKEYVYGNECVQACPLKYNFINNGVCSTQCPDKEYVLSNLSINSHVYHKCTSKCLFYVEDIYCTDKCSAAKPFVFNSTCLDTCPATHPLSFTYTPSFVFPVTSEKRCVQHCPTTSLLIENDVCLMNCTDERPYYRNMTCTYTCPDTFYITNRNGVIYCEEKCRQGEYIYKSACLTSCGWHLFYLNDTCQDDCPENYLRRSLRCVLNCAANEYIYNRTCVESCPENTYLNNTLCLNKCPSQYPFHCQSEMGPQCSERNVYSPTKLCVSRCPEHSLIYNNSCVKQCPPTFLVSEQTCVPACSKETPLIQNKTLTIDTWTYCRYCFPTWQKRTQSKQTIECVSVCRENMVEFNSTCASECPDNYPYIMNGTCISEGCGTMYMLNVSTGITCVDDCTKHGFAYENTCSTICPYYVSNNTCVQRCAQYSPFIVNQTKTVSCNNGYKDCQLSIQFRECRSDCPEHLYKLQDTCQEKCPVPYFAFNRTCLTTCPESNPFHQPVSSDINTVSSSSLRVNNEKVTNKIKFEKCVSTCSDPYNFLDKVNKACVDICPKERRFIFLNVCTEACSKEKVLNGIQPGIECAEACPKPKLLFNKTCISTCPNQTYNFNELQCVSECPYEKPFGLKEDNWRCIERCDSYKVFKDGKCIYDSDCSKPYFVYDYSCVKSCPDGFYYFSHKCEEKWQKVQIGVFVGLIGSFIFLLCLFRISLKEYFIVIAMIIFKVSYFKTIL